MIKSGGSFFYKGKRCTVGAVVSLKEVLYLVTVSHIFRKEGEYIVVDGMILSVTSILRNYDLALIRLPPESVVETTELGNASELEQAELINDIHAIKCRVVNAGTSLLYLGFGCNNMPEPGDSGSPILQAGKVIGFISSITLDTCMGTAISSRILHNLQR